jgi:hypothetical protein
MYPHQLQSTSDYRHYPTVKINMATKTSSDSIHIQIPYIYANSYDARRCSYGDPSPRTEGRSPG